MLHLLLCCTGGLTQDPAEHVHDRLDRKAEASSSNDLDMLQEEEQMVDQLQRHFQQTIRSAALIEVTSLNATAVVVSLTAPAVSDTID